MKPVIYQLFVRLFGNKHTEPELFGSRVENGCGKFSDINENALAALKEFGISHIWYTGVVEHAVAEDYSDYGIVNDYPEIVKGRAGSPYAIKDYFDVNPDLADHAEKRMDEFDDLVRRTHASGIRVLIDFVPNHVARFYKSDVSHDLNCGNFGSDDDTGRSFSAGNDFYYIPAEELRLPPEVYEKSSCTEYRKNPVPYKEFPAKATGNDCFSASPGINDWYETVKLNYGVDYLNGGSLQSGTIPPLWHKMKSVILYWAEKNVDGFRVDMAEMVPLEFWEWLIPDIKKAYPEIIFIAEIYQPSLYKSFIEKGRFDYLYDKVGFYETVRNIVENKSDTRAIPQCWKQIGDLEKHMLRFLENHDEQRIASRFFAADPWKALPGMILAATMNNGPLLIYFGQEVGEPAEGVSGFSGDDGRSSIFDYWNVPLHQKWMGDGEFDGRMLPESNSALRLNYAEIIKICKDSDVFTKGSFYDLMWVNEDVLRQTSASVYAYLRYYGDSICLIVLNFGNNNFTDLQLFIPDDAFEAMNIREDLPMVQQYAFPRENRMQGIEKLKRTGIFNLNILPLTSLILFFGKQQ